MCLAVPGLVLHVDDSEGHRRARVSFGGAEAEALLDLVPEAQVGDYVLVHVGVALSVVDADEARQTLALFAEIEAAAEPRPPDEDVS